MGLRLLMGLVPAIAQAPSSNYCYNVSQGVTAQ